MEIKIIKKKVYCPICNSNSLTRLVHRCQYSLYKCNSCSLTFKNIENLSHEIVQRLQDRVYTESYLITRLQQRRWIEKVSRDRLSILCKWVKRGDLLEIGCGTGEFLYLAREFGFNVVGVDASQMLVEIASKKEIDVRCGRIDDFEFSMSRFDVICIFHLIEHIETPKAFLAHLRGLLKRNGILFIITPNVESFTNKIFRWKHPNYTQKDHLYFYSRDTLKYILINQGFEVVNIFSKEYAHHLFASFVGFLRAYLKKSNIMNYKSIMTTINSCRRPKIRIGFKSILKWTIWQAPYFIGALLYPISWPYRNSVEKAIEGHELIIIAKKTKNEQVLFDG